MVQQKWYVVVKGLYPAPGIFRSWTEVAPLVQGVSGCVHQSFRSESEAEEWFERARASGQDRCLGGAPRLSAPCLQQQQPPRPQLQQRQYRQPLARSSTEFVDNLMESYAHPSGSGGMTLVGAQSEQNILSRRRDDTKGAVGHPHCQSEPRLQTQADHRSTGVAQHRTHSHSSSRQPMSSPPTDVTTYINKRGIKTRRHSPTASNSSSLPSTPASGSRRLRDVAATSPPATPSKPSPSRQRPLTRPSSAYVEPTGSPVRPSGSGMNPLDRTQSDRTVVPHRRSGSNANGYRQREPLPPTQADDPSTALLRLRARSSSTPSSPLSSPPTEVTVYMDGDGNVVGSHRGSISSTSSSRSRPLLQVDVHVSVHTPTSAESYPDHWTPTDVSDDSNDSGEEPPLSPLDSPRLATMPSLAVASSIAYRSPRLGNTSRSSHSVSPRTIPLPSSPSNSHSRAPSSPSLSSSSSSSRKRAQMSPAGISLRFNVNESERLPLAFTNRAGALHTCSPGADPRSPISAGAHIPLESSPFRRASPSYGGMVRGLNEMVIRE